MWSSFTVRDKVVLALLAALLVGGAAWRLLPSAAPAPEMGRIDGPENRSPDECEPELITVYVTGAVYRPDIYRLPAGSRVYEVLALAGGFTADADRELVNLARPLFDGEHLIFYRHGAVAAPGAQTQTQKININRATAAELETLPGIGAVRAALIIEHRDKHGPFTDIAEIMDVRNIAEGIFEQIKDLITVY